uniref:Uncharacterized protein n=1 Tax=Tetranychus urticae TaxID=32264 RepID=T1JUG8_TETUR
MRMRWPHARITFNINDASSFIAELSANYETHELNRLHPAFGADFSVQLINLIFDERRVDNFSSDDVQMMNDLDDTAQEEAQDLSIHSCHNCRSSDASQTSMDYSDFKVESDQSNVHQLWTQMKTSSSIELTTLLLSSYLLSTVYRLKETRMCRFLEKNLAKILLLLITQHHHHPVIIMTIDCGKRYSTSVTLRVILANVLIVITKFMYQCQLISLVCIFGLMNKAVDVLIAGNVSISWLLQGYIRTHTGK